MSFKEAFLKLCKKECADKTFCGICPEEMFRKFYEAGQKAERKKLAEIIFKLSKNMEECPDYFFPEIHFNSLECEAECEGCYLKAIQVLMNLDSQKPKNINDKKD